MLSCDLQICSMLDSYWCSRGRCWTCCLRLLPWRWRRQLPL